MLDIVKKIVGTKNDRELKKLQPIVASVNALESTVASLTDEQLRSKTNEFRERIDQGASIDDLVAEAFAVVRETGKRVLNMRHFDVQLVGGYALHLGRIAEM